MTESARAAFNARFLAEVDPRNELPVDERGRRAEAARRAYFSRLAHRSVAARRRAQKLVEAAAQADAELGGFGGGAE
jgi:hypothetical protein